ncbi:hypothetical protein CALVIDRAFT_600688, partial [Calocera viscosa TUFC12733]
MPTHIMGRQHTASPDSDSDSVLEIDSDDESDFSENVRRGVHGPLQVHIASRTSALNRFGPGFGMGDPLPALAIHSRTHWPTPGPAPTGKVPKTAVSRLQAKDQIPPLWTPGCFQCTSRKTIKHECRSWAGERCTNCCQWRKGCNLKETNSKCEQPGPAEPTPPSAPRPRHGKATIAPSQHRPQTGQAIIVPSQNRSSASPEIPEELPPPPPRGTKPSRVENHALAPQALVSASPTPEPPIKAAAQDIRREVTPLFAHAGSSTVSQSDKIRTRPMAPFVSSTTGLPFPKSFTDRPLITPTLKRPASPEVEIVGELCRARKRPRVVATTQAGCGEPSASAA